MKTIFYKKFFAVAVLGFSMSLCGQAELWTQDHQAVADLLQRYADDMQANDSDAAKRDLANAQRKIDEMKKNGVDVTASNYEGFTLFEEAKNAKQLTKSKVDNALRTRLRKLMDGLI